MRQLLNTGIISMVVCIAVLLFSASLLTAEEFSYTKGTEAYAKKDYKAAVRYLSDYVGKKPDAHAFYLLGYAYYKLNNHPESLRAFREAYNLDPAVSPAPGRR